MSPLPKKFNPPSPEIIIPLLKFLNSPTPLLKISQLPPPPSQKFLNPPPRKFLNPPPKKKKILNPPPLPENFSTHPKISQPPRKFLNPSRKFLNPPKISQPPLKISQPHSKNINTKTMLRGNPPPPLANIPFFFFFLSLFLHFSKKSEYFEGVGLNPPLKYALHCDYGELLNGSRKNR